MLQIPQNHAVSGVAIDWSDFETAQEAWKVALAYLKDYGYNEGGYGDA